MSRLKVGEDEMAFEQGGDSLRIVATGGPEDGLEIHHGIVIFKLSEQEVQDVQRALLNFGNTGYFDLEA